MIIEDKDKWEWKWNNKKRDRCDNIYKGTLDNCQKVQIGNKSTRKYCPKYTGKCIGNTNTKEDINCHSIEKIPRENVHNIDKIGNGYDSCCEEFNPINIVQRRTIDRGQIQSEDEILSNIGIRDEERLREILRLI